MIIKTLENVQIRRRNPALKRFVTLIYQNFTIKSVSFGIACPSWEWWLLLDSHVCLFFFFSVKVFGLDLKCFIGLQVCPILAWPGSIYLPNGLHSLALTSPDLVQLQLYSSLFKKIQACIHVCVCLCCFLFLSLNCNGTSPRKINGMRTNQWTWRT